MTMPNLSDFFAALQSGDEQAVAEMFRAIDPFLRRTIHLRLIDGRLSHVAHTTDILQSLLKDFLARKENAPTPDGDSGALCAYLANAVRNKVVAKYRKEDRRTGGLPADWQGAGAESAETLRIDAEDFNRVIRDRLPEPDRVLLDLRTEGRTWPEIAAQVRGNPDALRMRLTRAVAAIIAALDREGP
jgi:DNA-directed RNA polymerase specialized sigma24 family protein